MTNSHRKQKQLYDDDDENDDRVKLNSPKNNNPSPPSRPWLFVAMIRCPYPFLVSCPFLFFMLICLGLSRPSIIEEDVSNLWIPTDGTYKKDKDYAKRVGANTQDEMSAFAAMAMSRNGENLFKEENLNAIVERMKLIETTPVMYKGINFTWNDICLANGISRETTYKMPCIRLSPMDLFQEAGWYFTEEQRSTWYKEMKGMVMKPIVVRYGVLNDKCLSPADNTACDHASKLRNDPDYAIAHGYPAEYAGGATDVFQDILTMELNDPCRICIEENIDEQLRELKDDYVIPAFTTLTQQLRRFLFALEERDDVRTSTLKRVESLIKKTATIATKTSREDVEDFYMYYNIRNLYAEGADDFQELYREVNSPRYRSFICGYDELQCPPEDISLEDARRYLLNHADNMFSSEVTFGAPFPFWSKPDGTGHLFAGNYPVSGSGINMSSPLYSLAQYLDLENKDDEHSWRPFFYDNRRQDGFVDPLGHDYLWETMVTTNPVYSWFMAGETEMTAHCGNGDLLGTNISDITIDMLTANLMQEYSQHVCTKYRTPFEEDGTRTQQHFARMWFDLLIDSPFVLEIKQGESDPYTWTNGVGCGYDLGYSRFSFTDQPEDVILQNASGELYNIDEGAEIGVIDRTALIGNTYPPVGEYSFDNPLRHVGLLQTFYATLVAADIAKRVQHENRPGGPLNITEDDAREVLGLFKESFESLWTKGWDDDDGEVQFVGFFDDAEVPGTLGTFLNTVTLSSGLLTAVSIIIIAVCSIFFLARRNPVESRVGITLIGVLLVMLAFFAAVGLGVLVGVKVNLTIAWSLPFIMIGLGVDNVYIILMSLEQSRDYTEKGFYKGMSAVLVPITMTSLVNLSMFAVMNVNDIPAVYLTAQVACFAVLLLYLGIIFCFPAYSYLDMKRQAAGRHDVFMWKKYDPPATEEPEIAETPFLERFLYNRFYQPLIFGESYIRVITHSLIWACAALMVALGLYGISIATVGLGLEDFLPADHQANVWATARTEILGSWPVHMNWPGVDYGSADTQMHMIQQFEAVANTPHLVEIDTRMLWIAELALWTTRQCDYNLALGPPESRICGRDQVFIDEQSICSGTWKRNVYGLREKYFTDDSEQCQPYNGGVCRPTSEMHPDDLRDLGIDPEAITAEEAKESWCPVFEGWSEEKMTFCIRKWYEQVDGIGGLVLDKDAECEGEYCKDYMVKVPIPYSAGPSMAAHGVVSHELTLEMMEQTRALCDQDLELHCWMSGPPFDFWSQYEGIQMNLVEISGASVLIGFAISLIFFACQLFKDGQYPLWQVLLGSLVGAMIIAATCFFCLVAVVGLSIISGVSLTAFSIMSFVLSVGFAVEYSVHIVSRWLCSDRDSALDRVEQTMSFLMLPTFMSFVSSTVGVICLAFTDFEFNTRFFFRPLMIVMFVTYFFGCYWLPVFLTWFEFEFIKFGPKERTYREDNGSPLCKMHVSKMQQFSVDSSEGIVIQCSTGSDMINLVNKSSDIETNTSLMPTNLINCANPTSGEDGTKSFDFLQPCMAVCGGGASDSASAREEQPYDEFIKPQETEENSLPSQLPRYPLVSCLSGEEAKSQPSLTEDNSILSTSSCTARTAPVLTEPHSTNLYPLASHSTASSETTNRSHPSSMEQRTAATTVNTLDPFDMSKKAAYTSPRGSPQLDIYSLPAPVARSRGRPLDLGNTPNALIFKPLDDSTQQTWHETGANHGANTAPLLAVQADAETSNHSASEGFTAQEVDSISDAAAIASSSSSNVFNGIDVVQATEAQNGEPLQPGIPLSTASALHTAQEYHTKSSMSPTEATSQVPHGRPGSTGGMEGFVRTDPGFFEDEDDSFRTAQDHLSRSTLSPTEATSRTPHDRPASTGGMGAFFRTDPGFFKDEDNGFPDLRKSRSSSPGKMRILRFMGRGSSSREANLTYGQEGLLNARDLSSFGGYDFSHVLEGTAPHVGPDHPPQSGREILRAASGEVLAVNDAATVLEDNTCTSDNTVKF